MQGHSGNVVDDKIHCVTGEDLGFTNDLALEYEIGYDMLPQIKTCPICNQSIPRKA
jgi:hypothetical protein